MALWCMAGAVTVPAIACAVDPGPAIAAEAVRRSSGFGAISARLQMELENRRGQTSPRDMNIQILEADGGRIYNLFRVLAPADVRGTALLSHSEPDGTEQQWLYLPTTQRVRRIAAAGRAGAFMGSEFTYHDLIARPARIEAARLVRSEDHQQRPCHVLGAASPDPVATGFTYQEVWVDQDDFRVWRVDYFHPQGQHRKTLTLSDHHLHQDQFWQAHQMEMVNHLTGNRTRLTWLDVSLDNSVGPEDFTLQQLIRD